MSLVVAIYALCGASFLYEGGPGEAPKQSTEIPVEIVVEPPPPPAPAPPPEPAEATPPPAVDLPPAFDAPRAGTADTDTGDKDKPNPPPAPAARDKTADRASGADATAEAPKPEPSPIPEPAPTPTEPTPPLKVSEGEVPPPAADPPATEAPSPSRPAPEPAAGKAAPSDAPMFASVPDVDFGAAMKAQTSGGKGRGAYTNVLYGIIMSHFHEPRGGRAALGGGYGIIVFAVDGQGRLINRYVVEESGLPELDRAAMEAVAAASPFPRPPPGVAGQTFRFKFGFD